MEKDNPSPVQTGLEAGGAILAGTLAVAPAGVAAEIAAATGLVVSAPAVAVVAGVTAVALTAKFAYDMIHMNDEQAKIVTDRINENASKQSGQGRQL